jgi:hypothetical protein
MKKIITITALAVLLAACTDSFETSNHQELNITNESLKQDFNFGAKFSTILRNLTSQQMAEDLHCDNFVRHTGLPTDFGGNRNSTTYYLEESWNNRLWNTVYDNVMSPSIQIKELATEQGLTLFIAWADLLQVAALSRLTVYHGPLVYSEYGKMQNTFVYDSEEFLYEQFFDKLDEVQKVFQSYADKNSGESPSEFKKFDTSYQGDLYKWLKFINSLRLRLAMRIVKADPVWAKEMFENAVKDPVGLITVNADNFNHSLYGQVHTAYETAVLWNDSRMGSGLEEFLGGYKDPRLSLWYNPVTGSKDLYADHPKFPYKGIAGGAYVASRDDRAAFSTVSDYFSKTGAGGKHRRFLTASEVSFMFAEAALRGWATKDSKTAGEHYEDAVRLSFNEWGITNNTVIDAYLNDDTSVPIDYVDPVDSRNSYKTRSTMTIKWNEEDGIEKKLEKIMTQKWIDAYSNANEIWSDHRRTGYPLLHYNRRNDSDETWGTIGAEDFIKRMPFVEAERRNNAAGLKETEKSMNGLDKMSTRLWIHPEGANF